MHDTLARWGGQMVTFRHDQHTGAVFVIAIHSTARGPAAGGTRAMGYDSTAEAVADATQLAEVMTMKMAAAGLPMGGGKSVIALPAARHDIDEPTWQHLLAIHADNLRLLRGSYWTGPDVGTGSADMDVLHTASGFAFGRTPEAGGPGSSAPVTAHGVHVALAASAARAGIDDLRGHRIAVQGLGAVGLNVVDRLIKDGADVTASDIDTQQCARARALGAGIVAPEDIVTVESDAFVPCATGGAIDTGVAENIVTRVVAGAANNVLADPGAADVLDRRGIVFAPDFIANGGGAMHLVGREVLGWSPAEVSRHVESIATTLDEVFILADREHISTETAARRIAVHRLNEETKDA